MIGFSNKAYKNCTGVVDIDKLMERFYEISSEILTLTNEKMDIETELFNENIQYLKGAGVSLIGLRPNRR